MELKSEPAYTETHVTDWEFATTGGVRVFTLEDGVDECVFSHRDDVEGGRPCYVITETKASERTVIFVGPGLIGYTQRTRVRKTAMKPLGPNQAREVAPSAHI